MAEPRAPSIGESSLAFNEMSIREILLNAARQKLSAPEDALDAAAEHDSAASILDDAARIDDALNGLANLTTEGNTFLADLLEVRQDLSDSEIFSEDRIAYVDNTLIALRLADGLTEDLWDEELPEDNFGQTVFELLDFDKVSKRDLGRVRVIGFTPNTGEQHALWFLDCRDISDVSEVLSDGGFERIDGSKKVYAAIALATMQMSENLLGRCWCFCANSNQIAHISTLKFHLVLNGCTLIDPKPLPIPSDLFDISDGLEVSEAYRQYSEPLEILGEYNSRVAVLDGFLSLYHVLENFMLRARIANVSNSQTGGGFFSMRDFKRLNLAAEGSESSHLAELFRDCWDKQIGGSSLSHFGSLRLSQMVGSTDFVENDFHDFLRRLTVKKPTAGNLNLGNWNDVKELLPKIVYQVRCSVVHNKETEFHISNRELDNTTRLLVITELLIPIMRRLSFGLPSLLTANPIMYNSQSIDLYQ